MKAIDNKTGLEIKKGDIITDFRGEKAIFISCTRVSTYGKSGKILVDHDLNGNTPQWELSEYYDKVYNITVYQY